MLVSALASLQAAKSAGGVCASTSSAKLMKNKVVALAMNTVGVFRKSNLRWRNVGLPGFRQYRMERASPLTEAYKVNPCELFAIAVTRGCAAAFPNLRNEKTKVKNILNHLMASAVLVAGIAGMSTSMQAADASNAASKALAEAEARSSQISTDWKSYTRQSSFNLATDAPEIARMKEDVSAAEKTLVSLDASRRDASGSQMETIELVIPVVEELADNATDAIDYLNKNQSHLTTKECREYLEASSDTSRRLADLISQLVVFGSGKGKLENAKRMLEIAGK
jgi:hypothetical protein